MACIDPPFRKESALAGQYAVELGIPYVTIDCPHDQALARQAAVLIISGEFRGREYPQADLDELFLAYQPLRFQRWCVPVSPGYSTARITQLCWI